jgi:hypothetical protein
MPIWKITPNGPTKVTQASLGEEILEVHLEDWIAREPSILGEPLLIIGRQVQIPDTKDRLDLLALDPQGKVVIVELKRGKLKDPVDMQALRYATYVSKWSFGDLESVAKAHIAADGSDFNFNAVFEKFCNDVGADEIPILNSDQRMIIVGSEVKEKLGSVALWLRQHNIDITVVQLEAYLDATGSFLLQPQIIIPLPVSQFDKTGSSPPRDPSKPWTADGRKWHLEKRCGPKTAEMLEKLDEVIQSAVGNLEAEWGQKQYVAYQASNYIWLTTSTHQTYLGARCRVKAGAFDQSELAKQLGVQEFDKDDALADKLSLGSSVSVQKKTESTDRVMLRVKEDFNLDSEAFAQFLNAGYESFSGH